MKMRATLAVSVAAFSLVLAGCSSSSDSTSESASPSAPAGKVGVILPDTASSDRWENADRPYLEEAFTGRGRRVRHPERQR